MLHVLGIDEDFEGPPASVLQDVVDGDVDRMVRFRPFDLVGEAGKDFVALQRLPHAHHAVFGHGGRCRFGLRCRFLVHGENGAAHIARAIGGAALEALLIGVRIDALEGLEGNVGGHVDRLGNRAVDIVLHGGLHGDVFGGRERLRIDEIIRQLRLFAEAGVILLHGIVLHALLAARAVGQQNFPRIGIGENRLDARGHIAREKRDGAGRRDGGDERVADAVFGDRLAHILIQRGDGLARQIGVRVEQREGALFGGEIDRGEIGRARELVHPFADERDALVRAIARPAHDERVGKPRHAEADAALGLCLMLLLGQREARHVHHIVHGAHGGAHQRIEFVLVERGVVAERVLHQCGEVDRAQQARPIGRQGLLAAGVRRLDRLGVIEIVLLVDAVDEDHARFGIGIGRGDDLVPQRARLQRAEDRAVEGEVPIGIRLHRVHEGVCRQHRQVEHVEAARLALGVDEILDVRVVAAHGRHHRAPARARRHDGAAHRVPHIHEGKRAGGIRSHAVHGRALGAQRGEVVADAAALLHGQRGFLQIVEDARHGVGHRAHHEAVEERHVARGACARENAAGRQEAEPFHRLMELFRPQAALFRRFGGRQRIGDALPCVLHGEVHGRAVCRMQAVFHVPDLFGDGFHFKSLYPARWPVLDLDVRVSFTRVQV